MASEEDTLPEPPDTPSLIIGIGASAGGLEPLQAFFSALPESKLGFVVVTHLDPSTRNLLPELLGRLTQMPVTEIRSGDRIVGGRIYVAPAQSLVRLEAGVLQVTPTEKPEDCRNPIDVFFQSLAEQRQAGAVGIILSGNGTDGTLGLKAISDAGGMTIAQDPATAKYDSMPRSASTLGMADRTLSPDKIADELMAYVRHVAALASEDSGGTLNQQITDSLVAICAVLHDETEHNFKHYKTSTLVRRIGRRMQVLRLSSAEQYVQRLKESREEVSALFKELLIGVTAFFRDPEAFEVLAQTVIPSLLENRSVKDPVRVWIPGCATGEEAYSIAMLMREAVDKLPAPPEISIFATDINEHALSIARQGSFPLSIAEDISPERLQRFFVKKGNRYFVAKELREVCLFSAHDLIRDPPFSRLDLISCRNLLIYLGQHLQKKLIPLFHYALRPSGFLFLGPSESISAHRDLFRPVDVKHRISQRMSTAVRSSALLNRREGPRASSRNPDGTIMGDHDIHLVMQRIVLDEFSPKSVVVNQEGQIVCASGGMENYLGISSGIFQNDVVKLAHSGLRVGLRAALGEAIKTSRTIVHDNVTVRSDKGTQRLKLTVQPMPQLGEQSGLYLVVFQDAEAAAAADPGKGQGSFEQADALIEQLERELRTTREDLEKTIQDLEAANEELKSSNEELLSMNEELQSTNEELETSKEEIQAANDALARSNSDLENLLASTRIATLFLDEQHHIVRFTPALTAIYNLIPSDVGRPLADITHRAVVMPPLPSPPLHDELPEVEYEIQTVEGNWYIRRVLPYRNHLGRKEGMVVTFSDVTALKAAQQALQENEQHFRQLADALPQLVWTTTAEGKPEYYNQRFYEYTGATADADLKDTWMHIIHPEDRDNAARAWADAVAAGSRFEIDYRLRSASGVYQWFLGRSVPVRNTGSRVTRWFGTNTNIHSQKLAEEALKDADRQKNVFLAMLAHELRNPLAPVLSALQLLRVHQLDGPTVQQQRDMIERQVQQMKRLLDDLLDVARITSGRIAIREDIIDVRACIEQAVETIRYAVEAKGQILVVESPAEPLYLKGDATRLTQVFTNLISNAVKFTSRGGRIEVLAGRDGGRFWLRVRDNGIGMTEATLQHAFELFSQADQSLDRSEGGLGLGLTLVQRLVDLHHGSVQARSDGLGHGSEFRVELPLSGEGPVHKPQSPAPAARRDHRLRILVVDDNVDAAEILAMLLRLVKHEVHIAYDGPSAMQLAANVRPDAVLLDIGLPGVDGYQVARELRKTPGLESTVLIALSGYGQDEDRRRAREAGFDHHMIKPVNNDELFRVLESVGAR
jgi:two-component system CheB/CheR fusion protein